ncbi:MAG: AmmeMemoRadiSam system protein B, partial [Phycisphaerae bacterium]
LLTPAPDVTPRVGRLLGLVAPHLDYPRGRPCYADAYGDLAEFTEARRFVVLGTNHFGTTTGVVGTRKDFETPFGSVSCDAAFMGRLERALDADLCVGELDHRREHSVELQVHLLRHALGARPFSIAPYLCPDPCGPTGTAPRDGCGVDLKRFAEVLGELIAADDTPTCIIAAADLSHVGAFFQDETELDADSLSRVEASDRGLLRQLERGAPETFRASVAERGNVTNICSVGCIFALATALGGRARAVVRRYHQSVTAEIGNCVTCAAMDYVAAD